MPDFGPASGESFTLLPQNAAGTFIPLPAGAVTNQILQYTAGGAWGATTLAEGYGITGFTAGPPDPAVSLSTGDTSISATVSLTQNTPTALCSTIFAAGTWELSAQGFFSSGNTQGLIGLWMSTVSASNAGAIAGISAQTTLTGVTTRVGLSIAPLATVFAVSTTVYLNAETNDATNDMTLPLFNLFNNTPGTRLHGTRIA